RVAFRIRALAICKSSIVGQASSDQPGKGWFCKSWTQPSSQVRTCTSCFQIEGWPNPGISLRRSSSGTVATWLIKRSILSCVAPCSSAIPALVNIIFYLTLFLLRRARLPASARSALGTPSVIVTPFATTKLGFGANVLPVESMCSFQSRPARYSPKPALAGEHRKGKSRNFVEVSDVCGYWCNRKYREYRRKQTCKSG